MTTDKGSKRPAAKVSHDKCVGVGICAQLLPTAFTLNAVGLSEFQPDGNATREELSEAVDACPMSAITLDPAEDENS